MSIMFKSINKENWLDCVNLKVSEEQEDFVFNKR